MAYHLRIKKAKTSVGARCNDKAMANIRAASAWARSIPAGKLTITISEGNTKTGRIPSLSLPPVVTCKGAPCHGDCYVCANMLRRECPKDGSDGAIAKSYARNLECWKRNRQRFVTLLNRYLSKQAPRFFRWHVSGDIISQDYADVIVSTAAAHTSTRFLVFTKQGWDFSAAPANLTVIASQWPNWKAPEVKGARGRAFVQDTQGSETRVPSGAVECAGNCETCSACWSIDKFSVRAVVFHKH